MSEYKELRNSILVDGTPDQCIGCHTPFLHADGLAKQVLEGATTQEQAVAELQERITTACRYGRAAVRASDGFINTRCMAHSTPTIAGMDSPPAELMNWDEWVK